MHGHPLLASGRFLNCNCERSRPHMADANDWNTNVINEFRANSGAVGGPFKGAPMLLLHTVGAKSGSTRVNPLMYQPLDDGRVAVFASKGGAPTNPDWYHNLR